MAKHLSSHSQGDTCYSRACSLKLYTTLVPRSEVLSSLLTAQSFLSGKFQVSKCPAFSVVHGTEAPFLRLPPCLHISPLLHVPCRFFSMPSLMLPFQAGMNSSLWGTLLIILILLLHHDPSLSCVCFSCSSDHIVFLLL